MWFGLSLVGCFLDTLKSYDNVLFSDSSHAFTSHDDVYDVSLTPRWQYLSRKYTADVVNGDVHYLCLLNAVYKPEDLNRSPTTDTPHQREHKSDIPKASRKGEGDKEKGKPATNSKSGSRQAVRLHHSTNNKTPS